MNSSDIRKLIWREFRRRRPAMAMPHVRPGVSQESGVADPTDPTTYPRMPLGNGFSMGLDSNANLGIFRGDGTELGYWTQNRFVFVGQNGNKSFEIALNDQGPLSSADPSVNVDNTGSLNILAGLNRVLELGSLSNLIAIGNVIINFASINTAGFGVSVLLGIDNRSTLTAVDASPITLYPQSSLSQPAIHSGQLYRLSGRILATAGTTPAATYTLKWTEGGTVITHNLPITALDTDADFSALIQPDQNTSITAQLTAISGTGTAVNVAASVERLA